MNAGDSQVNKACEYRARSTATFVRLAAPAWRNVRRVMGWESGA
ncbi:MAG: hypothetical protein ACYC9O_18055 [Candidatus Latescibacterota bacterium]